MKKDEEKEPNHERWLLTYSDLITLLMIFFVILYSSSNVDAQKYKALSQSFSVVFGGGKSIIGTSNNGSIADNIAPIDTKLVEQETIQTLKSEVDNYLKDNKLDSNVSTVIEERGLVIRLNDSLFFDSGKTELKQESIIKLKEIGSFLSKTNNYIRVEGSTDNVPISNAHFSSNWQLSVIRATNVVELLINDCKIPPNKLSAIGYGEFRPVASNSTEEGRAKNRRVDIVILNSKLNTSENEKND